MEAREQPRLPSEGGRQPEEAAAVEEEPFFARGAEVAGSGISIKEAGRRRELRVAEDRPVREREMHGYMAAATVGATAFETRGRALGRGRPR